MSNILNIQPFNEIFYKSCFYSSLFPVLNYYNKSIVSFLSNDIVIWEKSDSTSIPYDCQLVGVKSDENIINQLQLLSNSKQVSENIIDDIIHSIEENKVPLLRIDCFYSSIRRDLYLKEHWPHVLLVFGYDRGSKVFYVIEHKMRENMSYEKRTMSFDDVIASYDGYIEHFMVDSEYPTFYQYWPNDIKSNAYVQQDYVTIYLENLRENQSLIQSGMQYIDEMMEFITEICKDQERLELNLSGTIDMLNRIINTKAVDQYRLKMWFPNSIALDLVNSSIDLWKKIRGPIFKYQYTSLYRKESFLSEEQTAYLLEIERKNMVSLLELSKIKEV
jgi:hypothetical protein